MTTTPALSIHPALLSALGGFPPTQEQWDAISMPLEPFVIIAGAGSGKTTVMAARVVYLALVAMGQIDGVDPSQGAMPGSVLCLTFTNKATENLAGRVRRALIGLDLPTGEEPVVTNYHRYAARLLDRSGLLVGMEPGVRLLNTAQRSAVAQRVLDRMDFFDADATRATLPGNILKLADQLANHLVTPHQQIDFAKARLAALQESNQGSPKMLAALKERAELAEGVAVYGRIKRELGAIDFGDQIRASVDLVRTYPEVAAAERARFDAALLDEYQDTNHAQAALLREIFGAGYPVTAVGDPDQNIYAWRGASLHNLVHFPEEFPRADGSAAARLPLYTNFRSGSRILAAADTIVEVLPAEQRPDQGKILRPWEQNGDGEVELRRFRDEWQEVGWIADRVAELQEGGHPLQEIAVLSRKSRLFTSLLEAFRDRDIPVEVVGLAGLLQLPEVQEVIAYARAVADASANVAIARILFGPRYRVGYLDVARVSQWASGKNRELRDQIDEDSGLSVHLAEALTHLPEIEGLSDEGRERLEEFSREIHLLRAEARRPVGEFLAAVMRHTGLLAELDASTAVPQAAAVKRNLAAFLDEVHAFTPLEGELTLHAFLDYLEAAEAEERQEWAPAQPSDEASVKIMTVHQAKGLEFDTVFVPGLAHGLLPDTTIQQNPGERGYSMDFELRGDAASLPSLPGCNYKATAFRDALKDQERYEERRTCYVALTRARRRLIVTGAWFYGVLAKQPKEPSELLEDLVAWAEVTDHAVVELGDGPGDDEDPLAEFRERLVRPWPGAARRADADALFAQGWRTAATEAAAAGGAEQASLTASLTPEQAARFVERSQSNRDLAAELLRQEADADASHPVPTRLSPSSLVTYASCPKRFYWERVRPLPTFSGPAARLGNEVHAWIEHRSLAQGTLLDPDISPDLDHEELRTDGAMGSRAADLQANFLATRFADLQPLYAERAFTLSIDGATINGRIDAIYGTADGPWEIVDYKSGREYDANDPDAWLQLDLYALAAADVWHKRPEDLTVTYLFLQGPTEWTRPAGDLEQIRTRVGRSLEGIAAARYDPEPGTRCRHCDFKSFCPPGQAYLSRSG